MKLMIPITFGLALLLSPESLLNLGNGMGASGAFYYIALLMGAFVMGSLIFIYTKVCNKTSLANAEIRLIKDALGTYAAAVLPASARISLCIVATSILLVTSGYVFNEVFLYWFPNFAFAFLLLGLLTAINLIGSKIAENAQVVFVLIVFAGLLIISTYGILSEPDIIVVQDTEHMPSAFNPIMFKAILLYMGIEIGLLHAGNINAKALIVLTVLGCVLFLLLGNVYAKYVPLYRLADSTVPHMILARKVLDQPGRIIMGLIVIFGSSAAINALLISTSKTMAVLKKEGVFVLVPASERINIVLLASGSAAIMAAGFAGEPRFMQYFSATIILWLINYSVVVISYSIGFRSMPAILLSAAFIICIFFLIMGFEQPAMVAMMAALTLMAMSALVALSRLVGVKT